MKFLLTIAWIASSLLYAAAQNHQQPEVPAAVRDAVKAKYPNVTDIKWKAKDDEYRAEFKIDKRGHDVWLQNGNNQKTQARHFQE